MDHTGKRKHSSFSERTGTHFLINDILQGDTIQHMIHGFLDRKPEIPKRTVFYGVAEFIPVGMIFHTEIRLIQFSSQSIHNPADGNFFRCMSQYISAVFSPFAQYQTIYPENSENLRSICLGNPLFFTDFVNGYPVVSAGSGDTQNTPESIYFLGREFHLQNPKGQFTVFCDHILVPCRFPYNFHIHLVHAFNITQLAFDFLNQ
jgi:hypothetical protein